MFCIETYLAPSSIHGIGCFSNQTVKQAEIVARRNPHIDQEISQQLYDTFSENEKNQIKKYAWKNKENGNIMLNTDDTRFLNHSDTPNLGHTDNGELFALKDIAKGEELTDNYFEIDNGYATSFL